MSKKPLFRHNFLMCRPDYFSVSYRINPWMEPSKNPSNWQTAADQWQKLHHLLIRLGGYVEYIKPQPGLPDMVFAANHGLLGKDEHSFVVPRFAHHERSGEESHIKRWLQDKGIVRFIQPTVPWEGAGDSLWHGNTLFCGYGIRSQFEAYHEIERFLGIDDVVYCRLVDDYFYHLDTCFCPVVDDQAIFFPDAFDQTSIKNMERACALHAIPEEEARLFACNSVIVGYKAIIPEGCPKTVKILESMDVEVYSTPMSEYIKAGGACKCCTLQLWSFNGDIDS